VVIRIELARTRTGRLLEATQVLIVEDEPLIRSLLKFVLEQEGFSVSMVSNGDQALSLLDDLHGAFQTLVTDIRLSRGRSTGWDVARRARELQPDMSVIYISGYAADDWANHAVPGGVLLTKPFDAEQVVSAVSQSLTGDAAHRP
jgi:DNA-binding NtrC family response regulator